MNPVHYRVQRGDTVSEIAQRFGVAPEALMRANGMDPRQADGRMGRGSTDPDRLQIGQQLRIPVATPGLEREHRVVAGETLAGIADHWGVSLAALLAANPQFDPARLGAQRHAGAGRDPDRLSIGEAIHRPGTDAPAQRAAARAPAAEPAREARPGTGFDLRAFTDPALGSSAPAAIVIGAAEGTRRADGRTTAAYGGHTDPGNAAHNRGSFSYQGAATSPQDADRRQLENLRGQLPRYEAAAREAGLDPNQPRLAAAYLDLYNQSPSAAARFLDQLDTLRGRTIDAAAITDLRVHSYVNADTGERFRLANGNLAGGGFANIARDQHGRAPTEAEVQAVIRADQQRRTGAVEGALDAQGLLGAGPAAQSTAPRWLEVARGELGTAEIRGARDNARVVEYHQATSLRARDDETSWCSSFVNWTMRQSGIEGTGSAAARSWLRWGQAVPRDSAHARPGDVIVFPRGNNPAQGHVAIVSEVLPNGMVRVVGGNQGQGQGRPDAVTESTRRLSDAIGLRRPAQ